MLDDVSYNAAKLENTAIVVDAAYVDGRLAGIAGDDNVARYIL